MKNIVLNNKIGDTEGWSYPNLTKEEERLILAGLFEQLLIFDEITITTNRLNFQLAFLIKHLGINKVEEFIDRGYFKFILWSPLIITGLGMKQPDGTMDESVVYGRPPIVAASLSKEDLDPEVNIDKALAHFGIDRERRRIFKKLALKNYTVLEGLEFSSNSAEVVIEAYKKNSLIDLGLPYNCEPEQLGVKERKLLLHLGYKVLETAVLAKYNLKSFENYEHYKICEQSLKNIGDALNVKNNTAEILRIENIPDLQSLYLKENLNFENIANLRYKPNAKFFRKWINEKSESYNAQEITKEYLNELRGSTKFFETVGGKFIKTVGAFGVSTLLESAISGSMGTASVLGFSLLETYLIDNILKGKGPSMFIGDIKNELKKESQ